MQTVLFTPVFERQAKAIGLTDDEVLAMASVVARDPAAGALMEGTGGARKLRHARQGQGKRGGYRTIHYFGGDDVPVFMLGVISKGDKDNLSKAERNALAALLPKIAAAYRARTGVKAGVKAGVKTGEKR